MEIIGYYDNDIIYIRISFNLIFVKNETTKKINFTKSFLCCALLIFEIKEMLFKLG